MKYDQTALMEILGLLKEVAEEQRKIADELRNLREEHRKLRDEVRLSNFVLNNISPGNETIN